MRDRLFALVIGILISQPVWAGPVLQIDSVNLDRPTIHVLGVQVLISEDDDRDAVISVRYRPVSGGQWRDGPPLFRVFPETVVGFSSQPQFAGSVFDLQPATEYEIELHAVDPDGLDEFRTINGVTRPVPRAVPAGPRHVSVASASELRSALSSAQAGDVITMAAGTYAGQFSVSASGTITDPIVVRGDSQAGVVLDGQGCAGCNVFEIYGSFVHLENFTIQNAERALRFQGSGTTGNVARRLVITNVIHGIASGSDQTDFYICDNIIEGRLSWPWVFDPDATAHWDDRGIYIDGEGHVVCHNRITGFGDPLIQMAVGARSFDFYGNDIYDTFDGTELDRAEGNVRLFHNRWTNVAAGISIQPVYGGPAYVLRNVLFNVVDEQIKYKSLGGTDEPSGALIHHNTFVSPDLALNLQTPITGHNFTVSNNLFVGPDALAGSRTVDWTAAINYGMFDFNGYYPDGGFWLGRVGGSNVVADSFAALQTLGIFEQNGVLLDKPIFQSGVVGPADGTARADPPDFTLASGSNAENRGVLLAGINQSYAGSAPDLGAWELGCPRPVYGPRPAGMESEIALIDCTAGGQEEPDAGTPDGGDLEGDDAGPSGDAPQDGAAQDEDAGAGEDTTADTGGPADEATPADEDGEVGGSCGCNSNGAGVSVILLPILLLAFWRKRRFLILVIALLAAGCAEEGSYRLHVLFENIEARDSTAEVAIWALEPGGRSCDDLESGRVTPDDMTDHSRLVVQFPANEAEQLNRVPAGRVLFFAEGSTDTGAKILRGCADAQVKAGATVEVTVFLRWFCRPLASGEIPGNGMDDDCDGETDECEQNYECDDKNACTTDLCASGECYNTEVEGVVCNDGDPCTGSDACSSGICTGRAKDCSQFDGTCVEGRCDPATGECGSQAVGDGTGCQDGLYCTVGDACQSGVCSGSPRDCADTDHCTRDDCDETANECIHTVESRPGEEGPRGDPTCSDGVDNDCDGNTDALDQNCGVCDQDSDCDDSDVCTQDVCDIDQCRNDPAQDGTQCDDGAYCTVSDQCTGGVCGGTQRDCSGWSDACHLGVCIEATDQCGAQNRPNGTGCDDGLYCTVGDVCSDGTCAGVGRDCSDTDICTDDGCSEDSDVCNHILQPNPGAEGPGTDPTCTNGVDDDCDGQTDGQDSDCECTPQCGIRECGPDPACGTPCGDCGLGESCTALGRCVRGEWVAINPGTFNMGSPESEPGRHFDEDRHLVELSHGFVIWSVEVTQEWYQAVMGYNPSSNIACGQDCPVELVSWHEAAAFCNAISSAEGRERCYDCSGVAPNTECSLSAGVLTPYHCGGYRLPTEAEWEYTARAGTTESTYGGTVDADHLECEQPNTVLDSIAWFCGNSSDRSWPAAGRAPNDWQLHDMLGNVWEWCQDWYDPYSGNAMDPWGPSNGMVKVIRGGSYNAPGMDTRSAYRATSFQTNPMSILGFRPVRSNP